MIRLSENTKAFLDGVCFASNFVWTEGGMGYEELNTIPERLGSQPLERERILAVRDKSFFSNRHEELVKLTRFLNGALGHNNDLVSKHLPISTVAERFLSRLNDDIGADSIAAELEEDSFGMDIRVLFADENDQVLSVLKMVWRID